MTERVLGPTGSRRRRRFLFVPMLLVSAVALMFVAGAQAVHGEAFQLDGDVDHTTTTTVGGVTQTVDWDSLFDANGAELPPPANFGEASFDLASVFDPNGSMMSDDDPDPSPSGPVMPLSRTLIA